MNKKGMTLLEMIVAIMILSIAGMMIFSGFLTVWKYIDKAGAVKNQSDQLNAYAENSDDADLQNRIQTTDATIRYTIQNDKGNQVQVQAVQHLFTIKNQGDINLKKLTKDAAVSTIKIKDTEAYRQLNKIAEDLIELADQYESKLDSDETCEDVVEDILDDDHGYNDGTEKFIKLSSEQNSLLPKSLNATAAHPYYVRIHYPWDMGEDEYSWRGGKLIYLSVEAEEKFESEIIHVIYDYDHKIWYYFKGNDYRLTNIDPDDLDIYIPETNMWIRNQNQTIYSWKAFLLDELKTGSGWYQLDEEARYDPDDPDAAWKPH